MRTMTCGATPIVAAEALVFGVDQSPRQFDQPRVSTDPAELHRCRTDAPVHAGHEVGAPLDGYRDLTGGWCFNRLDIPIEPLGGVDRRQRGARNVPAFAHRHLEQISGLVSPDISPNNYSGGARGFAATNAPEQGPQPGLLRSEIEVSSPSIKNRDRVSRD